jgi:hypothetical protein
MSTASPLARVAFGQSRGPCSLVEITVVGIFFILVLIGSLTGGSSEPGPRKCMNSRKVLAPRTSRCSSLYWARRRLRNSGPCFPQ